jgi:hypothetical protein
MKKKFLFGMIALLSASLVFMSCPPEADPETPATPSAAVSKQGEPSISGTVGTALEAVDVTIQLTHEKIKTAITQNADLKAWFANFPDGLTAVAKDPVAVNGTTVVITIAGTPITASTAPLAITIPLASLTTSTAALAVTNSSNIVFAIAVAPETSPKALTVTASEGATLAGAITTAFASYTKVTLNAESATALTLSTPLAVPTGKILEIGSNLTLTSHNTAGSIEIAGNVVVKGGFKIADGATSAVGKFTGTVTIESGAQVYDLKSGGGSLWATNNTGTFVYKVGSKGYIGGTDASNIRFGTTSDTSAKYQLTGDSTTFTLAQNKFTLAGTAEGDPWGVSEGMTFELLGPASVFTVKSITGTGDNGPGLTLIGATTDGGKLLGAGKVVIGNTEISGGSATGYWQAVGTGSVTINKGAANVTSIWSNIKLKGSATATITQKAGDGNVLNIGSTDNNTAANAVILDLTEGASLILDAATSNAGKIAISFATSYILLSNATEGTAVASAKPTSIGGKGIVLTGNLAEADFVLKDSKLVKIGSTNTGTIAAGTTDADDVNINKTVGVASGS